MGGLAGWFLLGLKKHFRGRLDIGVLLEWGPAFTLVFVIESRFAIFGWHNIPLGVACINVSTVTVVILTLTVTLVTVTAMVVTVNLNVIVNVVTVVIVTATETLTVVSVTAVTVTVVTN